MESSQERRKFVPLEAPTETGICEVRETQLQALHLRPPLAREQLLFPALVLT